MALNMQWTQQDFDKLMTNLQNMRDYEKSSVDNSQSFESCAHLRCLSCKGTGVKTDGHMCVHALSCSCSRCRTY